MFGAMFPAVLTSLFAVWGAPQVIDDLRLDFGEPELLPGRVTALQPQRSSKGKVWAYCADFTDDAGRGVTGTSCGLPLTTQVGPAELEVAGPLARVKGSRNVPRYLVALVVGIDLLYLLVGVAVTLKALRELQALRDGAPVAGTVVGAQLYRGSVRLKVRYPSDAAELEETVMVPSPCALAPGHRVVVLVHPRFPKVFVPWS